jgi:hypothetical protein
VLRGHPAGGNVSVWATPWSNMFMRWAFMKRPHELAQIYAAVPVGVDVLVSHQPPLGHGDRTFNLDSGRVDHVGSRELLDAIERVRPKVVICGHVHGGFGRYEYQGVPIPNVTVVDEKYRLVWSRCSWLVITRLNGGASCLQMRANHTIPAAGRRSGCGSRDSQNVSEEGPRHRPSLTPHISA